MKALIGLWNRLEEWCIVLILSAMTLVTAFYVFLNNIYSVFYWLGDAFENSPSVADFLYNIGDFFIDMAQEMTWSVALTKALFAWLIFFGIAYGVRIGGHIGVDALVKRFSPTAQRLIGIIACLACLGFAGFLCYASLQWLSVLYTTNIGVDDLGHYGVKQWHIALVVPLGFGMMFVRYIQTLYHMIAHGQLGLIQVDEAEEASKLSATEQE